MDEEILDAISAEFAKNAELFSKIPQERLAAQATVMWMLIHKLIDLCPEREAAERAFRIAVEINDVVKAYNNDKELVVVVLMKGADT